jgi:hypothetical protein
MISLAPVDRAVTRYPIKAVRVLTAGNFTQRRLTMKTTSKSATKATNGASKAEVGTPLPSQAQIALATAREAASQSAEAKREAKAASKAAPAAVAGDGQVLAAAAKKPAPVASKPAKGKAPAKAKAVSPTAAIRAALAVDPTLTNEAVAAALAKKGMNPPPSTIQTVRADFQGCLRAMVEAGRVKLN